jgi:rubrerythrin
MFCLPFSCGSGRRIERRVNQNNEGQTQDRETPTQPSNDSREYEYICPRCASVIEEKNLRFCPNCGNKL